MCVWVLGVGRETVEHIGLLFEFFSGHMLVCGLFRAGERKEGEGSGGADIYTTLVILRWQVLGAEEEGVGIQLVSLGVDRVAMHIEQDL